MRAGSCEKHTKKTMKLMKANKGREGGPTSMEIKDPSRLDKGKYKGTR